MLELSGKPGLLAVQSSSMIFKSGILGFVYTVSLKVQGPLGLSYACVNLCESSPLYLDYLFIPIL